MTHLTLLLLDIRLYVKWEIIRLYCDRKLDVEYGNKQMYKRLYCDWISDYKVSVFIVTGNQTVPCMDNGKLYSWGRNIIWIIISFPPPLYHLTTRSFVLIKIYTEPLTYYSYYNIIPRFSLFLSFCSILFFPLLYCSYIFSPWFCPKN